MTQDNNLLGKFELAGIPPAPRGVPQIEVTFEVDANGIMKVSAADKGTCVFSLFLSQERLLIRCDSGKTESITIKNEKGRLSQEEIDRMVVEGERFAEQVRRHRCLRSFFTNLSHPNQDNLQKEQIEALNALSSFIYGIRGQLNDQEGLGGKLDASDKKIVSEVIHETIDWIEDSGSIATTEELEEKLAGKRQRILFRFTSN